MVSRRLVHQAVVAGIVLAAIAGAVAARLVATHRLDSSRAARIGSARERVADGVGHYAYYLEDLADMVGVHDDADTAEFYRWAHVRGRGDDATVAVEWFRRTPKGTMDLIKTRDPISNNDVISPLLYPPVDPGDLTVAEAGERPAAASAIATATQAKRVALSKPVRLARGRTGFYLAVPIEAHRYSGDLSRLESRSAMVGLIDAQKLVAGAFAGHPIGGVRVSEGGIVLARVPGTLAKALTTTVALPGQRWTVTVAASHLSAAEEVLPWLILALGLGLAGGVYVLLREASRRREAALQLVSRRTVELEAARAEAERRSREDALTGVFNRRHFGEVLAAELARVRRGGPTAAVVMVDLDHFKQVNDEHGHLAGDVVLRQAAGRIASCLRGSDLLARWGGEEFAILAPANDLSGAAALAERVRESFTGQPIELGNLGITLTLSAGVALAQGEDCVPDLVIAAADHALYQAKRAGRNCVRVAAPVTTGASA